MLLFLLLQRLLQLCHLLIFGFTILELDVEPICIGFTDDDRLGGRGSSDNVQLALKLSKYLIAESSKRNSRWTLRSELGLNARGKAVSSAKSDSLQGGQLRSDQVVSVNKQWMGRGGRCYVQQNDQ